MPELPEVETTRRGILPHVLGRRVERVIVRQRKLRWPVPHSLCRELSGQRIDRVERRGKYLLLGTAKGTAIVHLGMSGSLRVVPSDKPAEKHDHVDIVIAGGQSLRLRDPRRFGSLLWTRVDPHRHALLANLGPEPLEEEFHGAYLHARSRGRRVAIRNLLIDGRVVAGIGNIYANEAAFLAGVRPDRAAGRISRERCERLVVALKQILRAAIERGGTTLRDFSGADGEPGYFSLELEVYGREGEACSRCGSTLRRATLGARSIFYCVSCQH